MVQARRTNRHTAMFAPGLLAVLLLGELPMGCGSNKTDKPVPASPDTDTNTSGAAAPDQTGQAKGTPSMTGTQGDTALVAEHYAKELKLAPEDIRVRTLDSVKVPGITVFSATANPAKTGRDVVRNGIVEGGAIHTEAEAMKRVAKAWSYGAQRTVSAVDFARVMGWLHSATHGVSPILDADTLDVFQSTAYPKQAAAAALPKETTVEGLPAVVYSITSGARSIPFTVVTAVVKPDFQVDLRTQPILND